ncbi:MAG: NADH:flavin oxidoreductase/NADH oxidase [Chloroflexi bacterium]|nr:NADH:flavin oxidoreductase/NADH oxidase [Chloroflexota bacterium]OJW06300.1 MAG: oxidoreductase [Chloroflexi bacterium 54-19]
MDLLTQNQKDPIETTSPHLFSPLTIRGITMRNRIMVSPMCMYSSEDGFATDWHLVHLGSRAVGGAGLVVAEATAVEARGRISPQDLGIWDDRHIEMLSRINHFIKEHGAVPGIQLAHAGRKASVYRPWEGSGAVPASQGGWPEDVVGPSPEAFAPNYYLPRELTREEIAEIVEAFAKGAQRAVEAGFEVMEIHGAHGYLLNEFLSPASNHRTDEYGGSLENRARFLLEVVRAIRATIPAELPLFVRLSATDWLPETEPSFTPADSVIVSKWLKDAGVDAIDASTGGNSAKQQVKAGPGYQVPFAEQIKHESGILTAAVGLIYEPEQADRIIREGKADMVAMARELLRDPYWPLHAARALGHEIKWPDQYIRAVR